MKTTCYFILLAILSSCNTQPKETKEQASAQTDAKTEPTVSCYQMATQADTITLQLVFIGENVIGSLLYQLKEKDRNIGTLKGVMKGDILVADYTFTSEGTKSTRQVAFKKTGNSFIEGYGESVDENGTLKFKNIDSLVFSSSMKLQAIECQ